VKTLILALCLVLAGCTHIHVQKPDGTVVEFYCSKNVRADLVKIGEVEIHGLRTDASGPIRAGGEAVGEAAKAAVLLP
jgi:hypothetical protein